MLDASLVNITAMGDIIEFPKKQKLNSKSTDFLIERLPSTDKYENATSTKFTCAKCKHQSNISFNGMIFKNCSFYCGNCGVGYNMSNPLFTSKNIKNK